MTSFKKVILLSPYTALIPFTKRKQINVKLDSQSMVKAAVIFSMEELNLSLIKLDTNFIQKGGEAEHLKHYVTDEQNLKSLFENSKFICLTDGLKTNSNIGTIIRNGILLGLDGLIINPPSDECINQLNHTQINPYFLTEEGIYTNNFKKHSIRILAYNKKIKYNCKPVLYNQIPDTKGENISLQKIFELAKKNNFNIFFLENNVSKEFNIDQNILFQNSQKVLIIVGNEIVGVQSFIRKHKDTIPLRIPSCTNIDSFNAATSVLIANYHYRIYNKCSIKLCKNN